MTRRFFTAGCWVLIATGLVHLLGHYSMMSAAGQNETERQMLSLMRDYRQDLGLGFVRSMFDIVAGFSLTFSILPLGMGITGLLLGRQDERAPGLVRQAAITYAGIYGIMTAIAFRYWFPVPLVCLAMAFLCFAAAVAARSRTGG